MQQAPITLIGAGLVGALLAQQLARRGIAVDVFEKRPDPRAAGFIGGRSINLALAERGLQALRRSDLAEEVLNSAVLMRGRMVHTLDGRSALQRYGIDDSEVIWSVSRGALNILLLDAAEKAGARFHFGQTLVNADFVQRRIRLAGGDGVERAADAHTLIGADGAGSTLRSAMNVQTRLGERIESLGHGYKELEIPPANELPGDTVRAGGGHAQFALEPNALHIWPRGGYMCIALPNTEGSFTVTLFLPTQGAAPSFVCLPDAAAANAFFVAQFPDLLPQLAAAGARVIINYRRSEDEVQRVRQPDTNAIAEMALENYVEMRDAVVDPHYLAKRELGAAFAARAPQHYMARYRMVSFTHLPYAYALERGRAQDALMQTLLHGQRRVADIDLDAAVATLRATLPPLPPLRHG